MVSRAVPGRGHVRVRRAELAQHLPEQVGEVARAADPVEQRPVVAEYAVPVHPGHVRIPEIPAQVPPCLAVGVPPQRGRVGLEPGPGQVDGDGLPRVVVLARRRDDPQLVVVADDDPGAVAADAEPVQPAGQLLDLALAQVEALQRRTRPVVVRAGAALAEHAGDRLAQPRQPALDRAQGAVTRLLHREGHHPPGQAVRVDRDGHLGRGILVVVLAQWPAARRRAERRRGSVRPAAPGRGGRRAGTPGRTCARRRPGRSCAGTGRPGKARRG